MKIYTKTGDKGETSLYGGKRVSKANLRVEAYGTIDELNSVIGIAISKIQNTKFKMQNYADSIEHSRQSRNNLKLESELIEIQKDLMRIGSMLASPNTKYPIQDTKYFDGRVKAFEDLIDDISKNLPELKNFILPGGGEVGAVLHFARTVCRRTERKTVELSQEESLPSEVIIYFNRLSDLFFTMARFMNFKEGKKEIIWIKTRK